MERTKTEIVAIDHETKQNTSERIRLESSLRREYNTNAESIERLKMK